MSNTDTITLTRALVELKTLEKRIRKKLSTLDVVAVKVGTKLPARLKSEDEYSRDVKAAYQSIQDMTRRKERIKNALVLANAKTEVTVAGNKMTIAEAIERKTQVELEKDMIKKLRLKLAKAEKEADTHNELMKERLQKLLESTYGKRDTQVTGDDYERIRKPFMENNEAKLVDPLGLNARMKKLEEQIGKFADDVDVSLSIANATTTIEV